MSAQFVKSLTVLFPIMLEQQTLVIAKVYFIYQISQNTFNIQSKSNNTVLKTTTVDTRFYEHGF